MLAFTSEPQDIHKECTISYFGEDQDEPHTVFHCHLHEVEERLVYGTNRTNLIRTLLQQGRYVSLYTYDNGDIMCSVVIEIKFDLEVEELDDEFFEEATLTRPNESVMENLNK